MATVVTGGAGVATLGTGAFTSVSADRDISVDVADDADALLGLNPKMIFRLFIEFIFIFKRC